MKIIIEEYYDKILKLMFKYKVNIVFIIIIYIIKFNILKE